MTIEEQHKTEGQEKTDGDILWEIFSRKTAPFYGYEGEKLKALRQGFYCGFIEMRTLINSKDIVKAENINAKVACAMITAMGMQAENMQRQLLGQAMAYHDRAFMDLVDEYGIHSNNSVLPSVFSPDLEAHPEDAKPFRMASPLERVIEEQQESLDTVAKNYVCLAEHSKWQDEQIGEFCGIAKMVVHYMKNSADEVQKTALRLKIAETMAINGWCPHCDQRPCACDD